MNKGCRTMEFAAGQTASGGKLSDMQKIMRLAVNSFAKEKYSLAIDYCRKAVDLINGNKEPAAEAYYIWCQSHLKLNRPDDARKVCYDARLKLGNYLDLVYFEILVAAARGETEKIPRFAESFLEFYEAAAGKFNPVKEKTSARIGEVLLLAGESLEKLQEINRAVDVYEKYLAIYPEDDAIRKKVELLSNRTEKIMVPQEGKNEINLI